MGRILFRRLPAAMAAWILAVAMAAIAVAQPDDPSTGAYDGYCAEGALDRLAGQHVAPAMEWVPVGDRLRGRWRELPTPPFGSSRGAGAWTGSELLVIDIRTKRVAGYAPGTGDWTVYPKVPRKLRGTSVTWTDDEFVVVTRREQDERDVLVALDPVAGEWREMTTAPPGFDGIGAPVWTGELLVVTGKSAGVRRAAAYHKAEDCWIALSGVPGASRLLSLEAIGDRVLVATGSDRDGVVVAILDLATGGWTLAKESGLAYHGSEGVWTGEELVFLSWDTKRGWLDNAAYDPDADTWRPLEPDCRINTNRGPISAGGLIVNDDVMAFDPATERCLELPERRSVRTDEGVRVWTGGRIIEWAGHYGDDMRPGKRAFEYRPR